MYAHRQPFEPSQPRRLLREMLMPMSSAECLDIASPLKLGIIAGSISIDGCTGSKNSRKE